MKKTAILDKTNLIYIGWNLLICEIKRLILGTKYIAEMDITDNCNLRCKHCYQKDLQNNSEPIALQEWEQRFNSLYNEGVRVVAIVGGEPSLRPDVLELADRTFPVLTVITNGIKKITEDFRHPIFVSVDGAKEKNDSIRGKGTFDKILKNYSGDSRAYINITLLKENYRDLEEVVRLAIKNGFRGVVCNIYSCDIGDNNSMVLTGEDRKRIIAELKRVKTKYPKMMDISWDTIKWFEQADHRDSCFWREHVLHYDVQWNKRKCYSNEADCSACGCFSGALGSPWKKIVNYPINLLKNMRPMPK